MNISFLLSIAFWFICPIYKMVYRKNTRGYGKINQKETSSFLKRKEKVNFSIITISKSNFKTVQVNCFGNAFDIFLWNECDLNISICKFTHLISKSSLNVNIKSPSYHWRAITKICDTM